MKKPCIILTGPTAVGKTALSIALAHSVNGEIISADSMQVYKYMDIGSAKIMPEEMGGIQHYLVDEFMPDEEFNVARFQQCAKDAMEQIYAKGKIPILVGGTGFYIQAVLYDIDFSKGEENPARRRELEQLAKEKGTEYLHAYLQTIDPESALQIHANNVKRVIRAIEYYEETKTPISKHNEIERQKESPYNFAYFVLNEDREILYQRINQRVDHMIQEGLEEEVRTLKKMGYHKGMVSMQGLGYKEILDYLDGNCSLQEAVEIIKRDTRHFAKRQLTWFKREQDVIWVNKQQFSGKEDEILIYMMSVLRERKIVD